MRTITGKFYEVGVKFDKTQEDGKIKKVTEVYAVDGLTFAEGEKKTVDELCNYISGEFEVVKMRPMKVSEIIRDAACSCRFWKAKVFFITLDEKTAKEKKTTFNYIVEGEDFGNAYALFNEYMKPVIGAWELAGMSMSPILDVLEYKVQEE